METVRKSAAKLRLISDKIEVAMLDIDRVSDMLEQNIR